MTAAISSNNSPGTGHDSLGSGLGLSVLAPGSGLQTTLLRSGLSLVRTQRKVLTPLVRTLVDGNLVETPLGQDSGNRSKLNWVRTLAQGEIGQIISLVRAQPSLAAVTHLLFSLSDAGSGGLLPQAPFLGLAEFC